MYSDSEFLKRLENCNTKGDIERLLYDHSNGRLSRSDCKTLVSKTFKFCEEEAAREKAASNSIYQIAVDWFARVAGRA
jgi:hypothetical protein